MKVLAASIFLLLGQEVAQETPSSNVELGEDYLHLVCAGAGGANKSTDTSHFDTKSQTWVNSGGYKTIPFEDQINIRFNTTQSWLRMPPVMLPRFKGGKEGWYKIKSLEFGEEEIKGRVAINALNRPKFRIDRITGQITMNGRAGTYTGKCAKFNPETVKKAF